VFPAIGWMNKPSIEKAIRQDGLFVYDPVCWPATKRLRLRQSAPHLAAIWVI